MFTLHRRVSGNLFVTVQKENNGKLDVSVTTARSDCPATADERDRALRDVLADLSDLAQHIRHRELRLDSASKR